VKVRHWKKMLKKYESNKKLSGIHLKLNKIYLDMEKWLDENIKRSENFNLN
jgi:hypothetical protein